MPLIISEGQIGFLDPQEKIWKGETGQLFSLKELSPGSDHLTSLRGISGFSNSTPFYNKTLFRFPLRKAASGLSNNIYTIKKVNELIQALRVESKYLLLFLRSVHTIEVYDIDHDGRSKLSFRTKIEGEFVQGFSKKRSEFLDRLKSHYYSQKYAFSDVISFTYKFDVCVYDGGKRTTSHWLVANRVDSTNAAVRAASIKQKVFPWVGTAVELDHPGNGRIFCFLPMPIEASSKLPVHVNGTFSLNDDRRSLKWPGVERRNDLRADWNQMLVKDILPSCYISLLHEAKEYLDGKEFYMTWPDVKCLRQTQWEAICPPIFSSLLGKEVIDSSCGWVTPTAAVYVPRLNKVAEQVKTALINCDLKLAEVPDNVWNAFACIAKFVYEVTPTLVCKNLRICPTSYAKFNCQDKLELLKYCLSEQCGRNQLHGLQLLPLANGLFAPFQSHKTSTSVYLITEKCPCPRELLPNVDHKLLAQISDSDLLEKLAELAMSGSTQLCVLDVYAVSSLLDEAMPSSWKKCNLVTLPDSHFQLNWFKLFWNWVRGKQLTMFQAKFLFPVHYPNSPVKRKFGAVKLLQFQPVLYIPHVITCDQILFSVLNKFGVLYCTQESFPFVEHQELSGFIKTFNANTLLEVIELKGCYASVSLSLEEAQYLRKVFDQGKLSSCYLKVLQDLKIFSSCANSSSRVYSISEVLEQSFLRKVVVEPSKSIDLSLLPENFIVLASQEYFQVQLLHQLGYHPSGDANFLVNHILPHVLSMGNRYTDQIMVSVLKVYRLLHYPKEVTTSICHLKFIPVTSGSRKSPSQLLDPRDECLYDIFKGQDLFPGAPYSDSKCLCILEHCGLRTSVTPQEIIDVIYSISSPANTSPLLVNKTRLCCAQAILRYLKTASFPSKTALCILDSKIHRGHMTFSEALELLSKHRNWIPILAERPGKYPSCLPWKGEGYTSHFLSLKSSVCMLTYPSLPLAYGSQAYFISPCEYLKVCNPVQCLVPHLKQAILSREQISSNQMITIVSEIYSAMQNALLKGIDVEALNKVKNLKKWVYIKKDHKFLSVTNVALEQNSTFGHIIEPYLYILPDSILAYSQLFLHFGMMKSLSRSQIISMLRQIKEEICVNSTAVTPKSAWSTVMAILNWLTENGTKRVSESLLVPVESESKWPDLRQQDGVVYGDNDYMKNFISQSSSTHTFVHYRINQSLAKCLNITPLSEELDISEDAFEDACQYESLTEQLKNILQDYKDGLTIIKEMIQNADDAEATEVNICFDNRTHSTDRSQLFFPDMCKSHGPALVIHNNSTFSNDDFSNILKLAGATKQSKRLKIGKFGVGFCSVYHITDVPSFVSRERLYIFDPTLSFIGGAVKVHSQPGKRVKFQNKIITGSRQMEPYEGLFGFKSDREYNATMFRLPFRKSGSELSSTCYSESTMRKLFESIQQCGDKLLLFLQHVKKITVQQFDHSSNSPKVIHMLRKSFVPNFLPAETSLIQVESISHEAKLTTTNWLVASNKMDDKEKTAVASIACLLADSGSIYSVCDSLSGEVFCYLPLAQLSGLPVHVSCNFTVMNNRRGIWTSDNLEDPSFASIVEVQWNLFLMNIVIPVAYVRLLCSLKAMVEDNELQSYDYFSLWPLSSSLQQKNPWLRMVMSFYDILLSQPLFYSEATSQWLTFQESKFLDADIFSHSKPLACIVEVLHHLNFPLMNLPPDYRNHFKFSSELITEENFVRIFFGKLSALGAVQSSRNEVIYYVLKTFASQNESKPRLCQLIKYMVQNHACIPTTPDGTLLKRCTEIIDPCAPFARLFEESDQRFPIAKLTDDLATTALKNSGIVHKFLPWELLIDRAQSVQVLIEFDRSKALNRVSLILMTMSSMPPAPPDLKIGSIPFLPVMNKPEDYPFSWHGDNYQLLPGNKLMLLAPYNTSKYRNLNIAGSQVAFINENPSDKGGCGMIYSTTRKLLSLRSDPTLNEVVSHLKVAITTYNSQAQCSNNWINWVCRSTYDFLNTLCQRKKVQLNLDKLKSLPCIWNGKIFLEIDSVALKWKKDGPYLFAAPPDFAAKEALTSALNIKETFNMSDAIDALQSMKFDFGAASVSERCMELIREMVPIFEGEEEFEISSEPLYLPDTQKVLRASSSLVYNDVSWAPLEESCVLVHSMFSRNMALRLGVHPQRAKLLNPYISDEKKSFFQPVPFGQHEKLTRRIQNIIDSYPFDNTLLKELLQNADDARAKKMYFILDKRTHGKESVISERWHELQGPALLAWNDSVFTEDDLRGIQELGLGGKRSNADAIGQFGIGFNVVYNLTDCPSFVTGGDTFCILDPHCRYVPLPPNEKLPGARYDNLSQGFWTKFKDMGSAYLQTQTKNLSDEFKDGSLFRFPIRHSLEMVKQSEIVSQEKDLTPRRRVITAETLSKSMSKWVPQLKQAMFFLNHVTEIKYFEIDSTSGGMEAKFHYKTQVTQKVEDSRRLKEHVSKFTEATGCESCVVLYPLTLTDIDCSKKENSKEEQWLIQQGIGDINDRNRHWHFIKRIKPKHSLAASLKMESGLGSKSGKLFCFLPLSTESGVPLHVNGSFALSHDRRGLWVPSHVDDKRRWNDHLFQAIASSYADFLVQAREYYIKESYEDCREALNDVINYYKLFPTFTISEIGKIWDGLPCNVYKSLLKCNSKVLCVLSSPDSKVSRVTVKWHHLISSNPAQQVHCWTQGTTSHDIIHPVLQSIGIQITSAPAKIMRCVNSIFSHQAKLDKVNKESESDISESAAKDENQKAIPFISPASVFKYYTKHSALSSESATTECPITATPFGDADTFLVFVKFLVGVSIEKDKPAVVVSTGQNVRGVYESNISQSIGMAFLTPTDITFPEEPFQYFLLLTADGNLRKFDEKNKVLNSKFYHLFETHMDKFLHPVLQEIRFISKYFIQPDDVQVIPYILNLFEDTFSPVMKSTRIGNASEIISRNDLLNYWKCFKEDKIFSKHLLESLKHWALLLSVDNQLFSTSNGVLPAYSLSIHLPFKREGTKHDPTLQKVYNMMKLLKMPFLDVSVVIPPVSDCPHLTCRDGILRNFYYTNKESLLTTLLSNEDINDLINYFSRESKPSDDEWLERIRSLPLFLDVANCFQPILDVKAILWPDNCCEIGYSEWIAGTGTVFVKDSGRWTCLGSAKQLSIDKLLTAEQLYTKYVFPKFYKLSETDRYKHLNYLRCSIYPKARNSNSKKFINALKKLMCIGPDCGPLKPISAFCDHTVEIFNAFPNDYQKLPKELQNEDWLIFFRELGLKVMLEQEEYLRLCRKVAVAGVNDVTKTCSSLLLKYLFSYEICKVWYTSAHFLKQVSNITFVPMVDLSSVSWLVHSVPGRHNLVKLNGAALEVFKKELWTVRPIVQLPQDCIYSKDPFVSTMLKSMNVIFFYPGVTDVVQNIKNISQHGLYTSSNLFKNYPASLQPPAKKTDSLLHIMLANFNVLNKYMSPSPGVAAKGNADNAINSLIKIPCIPVYSHLLSASEEKMVLVEPSCVLVNSDIKKYHPYLHSLPAQFTNCLTLLQNLGVEHTLKLHHMQVVLYKVFMFSGGKGLVDPNLKESVKNAILAMKSLLHSEASSSFTQSPLYLPDTSNELKPSIKLIYGDSPSFFCQMTLDLSSTEYSHVNITKPNYGTDAVTFCRLLPKSVRPLGISVICTQLLARSCIPTGHSECSGKIEASVKFENNHLAIQELVSKFVPDDINEEALRKALVTFFNSLQVVAVHNLRTQLILKKTGREIGLLDTNFFIEVHESVLYIDHAFDDDDEIMDEIIEQLHKTLSGITPNGLGWEANQDLYKVIKKYLKADTAVKKENLLGRYQISGIEMKPGELTLGEEIPQNYSIWLDQSPYNIFNAMEYVGYALSEGHMIVAKVLYLVQSSNDCHSIYYIILSEQEGREVSVFDLYKFVMEMSFESSFVACEDQEPKQEISDIKKQLDEELRKIWRLDSELRSKAIKRLYLKWHPDKNLGNCKTAEEIFAYLKRQVDHLKRRDKLASSSSQLESSDESCPDDAENFSGFPFNAWNATAGSHRAAFEQMRARCGTCTISPFAQFRGRMQKRPEEGRRWVKQAVVDFKVLCGIYDSLPAIGNRFGHVCFMAHQVAEKALKGGVYALCGMDDTGLKDHELGRHACALETACPGLQTKGLHSHASSLKDYYIEPRYPNKWPSPNIPADYYDEEKASKAREDSKAVLDTVRSIIPS